MMNAPYKMEQVFDAPMEKVWEAITNKDQLKHWYFAQIKKFEPVIDFKFEFTSDGSVYQKEWVVTDVIAGRMFAHTWLYKGYAGSSEVIFELYKEGTKTRLKLTHTGLESFPDDPHFARHNFESGWKRIIGTNLKNYLAKNNN